MIEDVNARILPQACVQRAAANVHRVDEARSMLKQAVGEPPRRGTHVHAYTVAHTEPKMCEGCLELQASAADVFLRCQQVKLEVGRHLHPGFEQLPLGGHQLARQDQPLGLLTRLGQPTLHSQNVEPDGLPRLRRLCRAIFVGFFHFPVDR